MVNLKIITYFGVFLGVTFTEQNIPDGYYFEVDLKCDYRDEDDALALISVRTNLQNVMTAYCNNQTVLFKDLGNNSYHLYISYGEPQQGDICYFWREIEVYTVPVLISWGETGSHIQTTDKRYRAVCTRGEGNDASTERKELIYPITQGRELQQHIGGISNDSIRMTIIDIQGKEIIEKIIPIGKRIRLKAEISGVSLVSGIMAASCIAVGSNSSKFYPIIKGGCGDGFLIPRTDGFVTIGKTVTSPEFPLFQIMHSSIIEFRCNFSMCSEACEGNNCAEHSSVSRIKRHARDISTSLIDDAMPVKPASIKLEVNGEEDENSKAISSDKLEEFGRTYILPGTITELSEDEFENLKSILELSNVKATETIERDNPAEEKIPEEEITEGACGTEEPASVTSRLISHAAHDPYDVQPEVIIDNEDAAQYLTTPEAEDFEKVQITTEPAIFLNDKVQLPEENVDRFLDDSETDPVKSKIDDIGGKEGPEEDLQRNFVLAVITIGAIIFVLFVTFLLTLFFKNRQRVHVLI